MTPEGTIQAAILGACNTGPLRLFRNQVGMAFGADGRPVRFGLCPGSSDLVGIKKTLITEDMVGRWIGRFVALEVKSANGRLSAEQSNFLNFIADFGGIAAVCKSPEDAKNACW